MDANEAALSSALSWAFALGLRREVAGSIAGMFQRRKYRPSHELMPLSLSLSLSLALFHSFGAITLDRYKSQSIVG